MKELRFRMRNKTTGRIINYVDMYDLLRHGSDILIDYDEAILDGVEFEQYTGFIDRKGADIYEGDILSVLIGGIKQSNPYLVEDIRELYLEFEQSDPYYAFTDAEVIGSAHHDKELLKECWNYRGEK